jgi:translation initiation factor IF-3
MEARAMTIVISPKPAVMQKVAQAKILAEKERQRAEKEGRVLPPEPADSLPSMSDVNKGEDDDDDDDDDDAEEAEAGA